MEVARMRGRFVEVLVSLVASAIMALLVAIGGSAVGRATDTACPADGASTCSADPFTWCRPLNGQTICIREKT